MSKEWHAAARAMLTKQCEDCDIVITTALIPGRIKSVCDLIYCRNLISSFSGAFNNIIRSACPSNGNKGDGF
jgi:hypothetical protein